MNEMLQKHENEKSIIKETVETFDYDKTFLNLLIPVFTFIILYFSNV